MMQFSSTYYNRAGGRCKEEIFTPAPQGKKTTRPGGFCYCAKAGMAAETPASKSDHASSCST